MRITGGRHRGRRLRVPAGPDIRPTTDRLREALFDILAHGAPGGTAGGPVGAHLLDAFAGSGAVGLEALSRGAARATFMDTSRAARETIAENARGLGEDAASTILAADPCLPPRSEATADLVWLDPPWRSDLAGPALAGLAAAGWIGPRTGVIVEVATKSAPAWPPGFTVTDRRRHGRATLVFLCYEPDSAPG